MIEELKEEKLIEKVGGRFRLSALIQKRLVFLNKGAHSFVSNADKKDKLQIVIQEILEDKIYLNMDGEVVENIPAADENVDAVPAFDDFGNAAF
ncbi:MAG: DNA-directed RNA polymerase subunit omega [Thermoguttaceae bacterium]|nr:DNA-directed RNA polymerase subunit omega [Thermoguttaceae bacterium]